MHIVQSISQVLSWAGTAVAVVLIFSILVIAHEFGHFLVARACGMRVDEFGIGFGKRLLSWKRGNTVYSINLFPIGGFNKIYGMDVEDPEEQTAGKSRDRSVKPGARTEAASPKKVPPDYSLAPPDDPLAFVNRPLQHRFLVALAGSTANLLVAVLVVFIMGFTIGFPAAELGGVIPGGPAAGAGLMTGDIITHLDGARLSSTTDLRHAIVYSNGGSLHVKGIRGSESFNATVVPQPIRLVDSHFCRLGFVYLNDGTVIYARPGSPADRSDLAPGDMILEVDGIRFPSHRLEVNAGSGIMRLKVFRGYRRAITEIEYFDSEISHDSYSMFGFFHDSDGAVTDVIRGGIADEAGLGVGDVILSGIMQGSTSETPGGPAQGPGSAIVEYERGGRTHRARLEPDPAFSRIQVIMDDASLPILVRLPPENRLAQSGMRSGDEILSIEGVLTPNGITAFLELEKNVGKRVSIVGISGGEERVYVLPIPPASELRSLNAFFSGIRFRTRYFASDPITSLIAGERKVQEVTRFIFMTLGMLITGEASIDDLAGPVGIATITYQAASSGLVDLVNIMVLLSVNLAIFNMLPFPALDGGRILFMFFEAVLRRPVVTVRMENLIHIAGFLLLMLLALFITYHDIARLFLGN